MLRTRRTTSWLEQQLGEAGVVRRLRPELRQPLLGAGLLVRVEVLPHHRVPDHGRRAGAQLEPVEEVGGARALDGGRHLGRELQRPAEPLEPLRLVRPDVGREPQPALGRSSGRAARRRSRAARRRPAGPSQRRHRAAPRVAQHDRRRRRADRTPVRRARPGTGRRAGSARRWHRSRPAAAAAVAGRQRAAGHRSAQPTGRPRWSAAAWSSDRAARRGARRAPRAAPPRRCSRSPLPPTDGKVSASAGARRSSTSRCAPPISRRASALGPGSSSWPRSTSYAGPPASTSSATLLQQELVQRRAERRAALRLLPDQGDHPPDTGLSHAACTPPAAVDR